MAEARLEKDKLPQEQSKLDRRQKIGLGKGGVIFSIIEQVAYPDPGFKNLSFGL
jgi:hypothetical protein